MNAAGYSHFFPEHLGTFPEKLFSAKLIQGLCFHHEAKASEGYSHKCLRAKGGSQVHGETSKVQHHGPLPNT